MAEVLHTPREGSPFGNPSMARTTSSSNLYSALTSPRRNHFSLNDLRAHPEPSESSRASSLQSASSSSLSLDTRLDESSSEDDGLTFPDYARNPSAYIKATDAWDHTNAPSIKMVGEQLPPFDPHTTAEGTLYSDTPLTTPDPVPISEDDSAVRKEPSHHVDYLSYEWREEDIWSSWRHIVEHRSVYGERSRLENASWRTWAKSQFKLKTVSPETLNWFASQQTSEPASRLSKSGSFLGCVKKPILKKRSMSEAMLQKSLSSSSLVAEAAEMAQAQRTPTATLERRKPRPIIGRKTSDLPTASSLVSRTTSREPTDYFTSRSTSGLHTPLDGEKKHIRFDDKVEQCIAIETKEGDDDEDDFNHNPWASQNDEDSSSDEGVVMMKRSRKNKKRPLSRSTSKTSISSGNNSSMKKPGNKTIEKLPSTTLKYRTDSPDVTEQQRSHSLGFWRSSRLSPSPSQETLRPSHPSSNFLLPEDDDEEEDYFNPSGAFGDQRPATPTASDPFSQRNKHLNVPSESGGLRRTASGMIAPFEDTDDEPQRGGILGSVVDTVNTARDIAHVIWNVGWKN
ncbi:protein phosphatase regulator [Ascochyta clinopodiicola]|nr:protein phosphatase regulator [Ascochyta clinopodiicola]